MRMAHRVVLLSAFAALAGIYLLHAAASSAAGPAAGGSSHIFLPLVMNDSSPSAPEWGSAPTSGYLIDQAQASGAITADTAMLYKVYAAYGDPRLPAQYQGAVPFDYASSVARDLHDEWSSLSPTTQATIQPFLLPPIYAGSWGDPSFATQTAQRGARSGVRSATPTPTTCTEWFQPPDTNGLAYLDSAHFRVWYWKDGFALGNSVLTATQTLQDATMLRDEAENVYSKETALFGKTPVSDAGNACNGGDGRYDIYIYDDVRGRDAATLPYTPYDTSTCTATPTWTGMNPLFVHAWTQEEEFYARDAFAHEFAHVLDWAYNRPKSCHEYNWLSEAMGNAMIDYVYPTDNVEQNFPAPHAAAPDWYYTDEHTVPLEQAYDNDVNGYNGYADYMFLFDLAHRLANWPLMKTIWDKATTMGSVDAIDAAIPGGFAQQWPLFAANGWNPYDDDPTHQYDLFHQWDQMVAGEKYAYENQSPNNQDVHAVNLHGGTSQTVDLMDEMACDSTGTCKDREAPLNHLSIHYDYLTFPDDNVRSIAIYNGFADAGPEYADVHVQVLAKIGGQWQPLRDLTGRTGTNYCRDLTAERVQELLVVWSNASKTQDISDLMVLQLPVHPKLVATNVDCWRWTGSFSGSDSKSQPWLSQTWSGTVTYERVPPAEPYVVQDTTSFTVASASVHWVIGTGPQAATDCTYSGDATFTVPGNIDSSYGYLTVSNYSNRSYYASFGYQKQWPSTYTADCSGEQTVDAWPTIWQLLATTPNATVNSDGATMQGDLSGTNYNGVYHWSLTAERQ